MELIDRQAARDATMLLVMITILLSWMGLMGVGFHLYSEGHHIIGMVGGLVLVWVLLYFIAWLTQ